MPEEPFDSRGFADLHPEQGLDAFFAIAIYGKIEALLAAQKQMTGSNNQWQRK